MDETALHIVRWQGKQLGPYGRETLQEKLRLGELSQMHEVKVDGQWVTLRSFLREQPAPTAPAVEEPQANHSATSPVPAVVEPVAQPVRFNRPQVIRPPAPVLPVNVVPPVAVGQESAVVAPGNPSRVRHAGFWRRTAAALLDGLLLGTVGSVLLVLVSVAGSVATAARPERLGLWAILAAVWIVLQMSVGWVYFAALESSVRQASLGKRAVGIVVTDMRGERISFARASGRYWAKQLSSLLLMMGFIMAGFTARKQALHDLLAGCLVVVREEPD